MKMLELESEYQGSLTWSYGGFKYSFYFFRFSHSLILQLVMFLNVAFPHNGIFMDLNILLIFDYFAELNIIIFPLFLF